jgi:hypothetical protein
VEPDGGDVAVRIHRIAVDRAVPFGHDHLFVPGHVDPVVIGAPVGAPVEPALPRPVGEEVLLLEPVGEREPPGALAHQHDVVGVEQHVLGHDAGCLDSLQRADGSRSAGGPVHARCVELDDPVLVRQAAIAHRAVLGVQLLDLHTLDGCVERVDSLLEQCSGLLHSPESVGRRDGDGTCGRPNVYGGRVLADDPRSQHGAGGEPGGGTQKVSACE